MEKESKYQGDTSNEIASSSQTNKDADGEARAPSASTSRQGGQQHEQQANLMAKSRSKRDLLDRPVTTTYGTLPEGVEVTPSPLLNALASHAAQPKIEAVAQELAYRAEKYDRQVDHSKASYKRRKAADPDRINTLNKERQQRYRDRQKAAQSQKKPKS